MIPSNKKDINPRKVRKKKSLIPHKDYQKQGRSNAKFAAGRPNANTVDKVALLSTKGNRTLFLIAFVGLMVLLFYPPFFRGLFFPVEQRWALILAIILFLITYLWKLSYREVSFLNCPLDFAAAALVIVYILAAIKPASRGLAAAEIAKVLLFFLTYWLVSRLGGQKRNDYILHVLYLAAAGTAVAALLTATGIINIKDGFLGGRFYSTLQYPNALASYVGAGSIIGFYLWGKASRNRRYFYAAVNYLVLMVFLGTGSRGAYLLLPMFMLLFCLFIPRDYRTSVIVHLIFTSLAALVGNIGFIPMAVAESYAAAWVWFMLGLLMALIGQFLIQIVGQKLGFFRLRVAIAVIIIAVLIGGSFYLTTGGLAQSTVSGDQPGGILSRILPPQIMARIQSISLETSSSQHRLFWAGDAIKMLQERPFLGFGGGGWEAAYRQYQSYFYNSTQVHNHYAQVAVETGTAGIMILAAVWLLFIVTSWGNYRRCQGEERFQALAIGMAALSLGTHAAIDFNLALGAISIMLWAYFGLARNLQEQRLGAPPCLEQSVFKQKQAAYITALIISCLFMFLFSISYLMGVTAARRAAAALQRNDLENTMSYLQEAGRYDPFTASYHNDLAGIYLSMGQMEKALTCALAASAREPFNVSMLSRLGEIYWKNDMTEQALATMERARQASPWAVSVWENLAQIYIAAGINYLRNGKQAQARSMFEHAAGFPAEVSAKVDSLGKFSDLHDRKGLKLTPAIYLQAAIGQHFLGQKENAAINLEKAAADKEQRSEAQLWQAVHAYQENNNVLAEQLITELEATDTALAEQYEILKSLALDSKQTLQ